MVDINELALLGVGAVVVIMILAVLGQMGLSYLAQRNLNDMNSLGIQAVVGTNSIRTIDEQMDDGAVARQRRAGDSVERSVDGSGDGQDGGSR